MGNTSKVLATLGALGGILSSAHAFGGENLLSSKWRDWHHNTLTRYAAQSAGFFRTGAGESLEEEGVDSPAAEIAWHADFIDSYAYNPLYWALRGPAGYAAATAAHPELIKLHFDDLTAMTQVRDQYFQYTTGTVAGLLWAKSLFESGQRERGIAIARHLLGISLHALQDFYSHSSWVDDPTRGQNTWFYSFTVQNSFLMNTPLYTGAYERPEQLSVKPHGKIAPEISAFQQIRPVMDLLASPASPVHDLPVMDVWRQYRDRSVPITPGVFPSAAESQALAAGLKSPPSQIAVGLPPGSLYVAPPGIALDATYLCKIAAQERGFSASDGPRLFQTAYGRAFDGSVQWLKRLEKTMTDQPGGSAFWLSVKTAPPTARRQACFEDFADLGFQFISAGSYPPDSATTQRQLGSGPSAIPAKQYYLRVRLKTSREALSGTDADIYLNADGKRFLLDYAPVSDSGLAAAIFAHNDFEGGSDDVYTVGPFAQVPQSIELENASGDFGRVLLAIGNSFVDSIKTFFQSIADFFATITGARPDFVGQEKKIWSPAELDSIAVNTSKPFVIDINTANTNKEGIYKVHGEIRCTSRNEQGGVYTVTASSLQCIQESDLDQIGSPPGDEVFVLGALAPLPGDIQKARTGVKQQTRTGTTKALTELSFTSPRIPRGYGALAFPVCVMESDSETSADRDVLLNKFAGYFENKTSTDRRTFLAELGAAVAPDWKLEQIEVFAFAKGGAIETGTVLNQTPNRWIPGRTKAQFALNRAAVTACNLNVLDLQRLTDVPASTPNDPVRPKLPIKPDRPIKLGDPAVPVVPVAPPVTPAPPATPGVPGDKETPLGPPTTTGADFSLTLPKSVEVGVAFYAPPPLTITVRRPATLKGDLSFALSGAPAGVTGSFAKRDDNIYALTLGGLSGIPLGESKLQVQASVAGRSVSAPLLLIRSRARILLVDDDFTGNNRGGDPKSLSSTDKTFRTLLERGDGQRALVYDLVVVDSQKSGPTVDAMLPYDVVLWYCGTSYGGNPDGNATVGGVDESNLRAYLDEGGQRTLLLFSPGYINNIQGYVPSAKSNEEKWSVTESIFLKRYIGAAGGQGLLKRFTEADIDVVGKTFVMGRGPEEAQLSPINASSAQVIATTVLNPDGKGERAVPVATHNVLKEAHCVFVGFTFENVAVRPERLFAKLLAVRVPGIEGASAAPK